MTVSVFDDPTLQPENFDVKARIKVHKKFLGDVGGLTFPECEVLLRIVSLSPDGYVHIKGGNFHPDTVHLLGRWMDQNGFTTMPCRKTTTP